MSDIVILRRWQGAHGLYNRDLIALFPEQPADEYGRTVTSYMHVGQHSAADYDHVISQTKPVLWWDREVMDLLNELRNIGYEPDVRKHRTPVMRAACRREAERIRG